MKGIKLFSWQAEELVKGLNELLATYWVFYHRLLGFHWNITGKHFLYMHEYFEELYKDAQAKIDEIAERIRFLNGRPVSALQECLDRSKTKDKKEMPDTVGMLQQVLHDMSVIIEQERNIIELAQESGDEGTVDLVGGFLSEVEKQAWMVRATLENE